MIFAGAVGGGDEMEDSVNAKHDRNPRIFVRGFTFTDFTVYGTKTRSVAKIWLQAAGGRN